MLPLVLLCYVFPGVNVDLTKAFIDLILHELVDPQAHVYVVLEHQHNHTVEREAQVILRYVELPQLFVQLSQLLIALVDQVKRTPTDIVLPRHVLKTRLSDHLKLAKQGLDHLLDVVRTAIHVPVCQIAPALEHDCLIHLLVLLNLVPIVLRLLQLGIAVIKLLLT